jgi:hypothetical protein
VTAGSPAMIGSKNCATGKEDEKFGGEIENVHYIIHPKY